MLLAVPRVPRPPRIPAAARRSTPAGSASKFPLSIHASGRYFVDAQGSPFFLNVDAGWSAVVNLTTTQITAYVDDCAAKGFTGILVNAIEHGFSNQTPTYRNVAGQDPFTTMSPVAWASPNVTYWTILDHLVNYCKTKDMAVLVNPCYLGFQGGGQGWTTEMNAGSAGDLQTYGAWLANRYTQGNVLWSFGGDDDGTSATKIQQRNIQTGIRSVRTTDLVTFHTAPNENTSDVVSVTDYPNLFNWVYAYESGGAYAHTRVAAAYAASPTLPAYFGEGRYEGENDWTAAMLRRQSYSSLTSGALGGVCFGNAPIWQFTSGYASSFNSTGRVEQSYFKALVDAFQWWKLAPNTGTTSGDLVPGSHGTDPTVVCPALANDGTFAMIFVPSAQSINVNTTLLTGVTGNVRIRIYNVTAGTYSTVAASEAKNSSRGVTATADCVVVVDQG